MNLTKTHVVGPDKVCTAQQLGRDIMGVTHSIKVLETSVLTEWIGLVQPEKFQKRRQVLFV